MSGEKSADPQSPAPEAESLPEDNLESVSGGRTIFDPGCILLPIDEPTVGPFEPFGPTIEI